METVIIVIHLMVVIALVGVVLVQRSEGGGLGIGGGSGFMSARGAANALTRTTAILAAIFFATSLGLTLMARYQGSIVDILDRPASSSGAPAKDSGGKGVLDQLGGTPSTAPAAKTGEQPAVPNGQAAPNGNGAAPAPATNNAPASGAPAAPTPTTQVPSGSNEPAGGQAPASGGNSSQAPAQPQVPNQ
ncbi:MAG: preprotein translocase subunit SecG [Hyphomicrobiales bacterium]|nr:preprotein translocase subunit SecG [Hyphomicrobiales bacterium]